jgi:hypothetical protein
VDLRLLSLDFLLFLEAAGCIIHECVEVPITGGDHKNSVAFVVVCS